MHIIITLYSLQFAVFFYSFRFLWFAATTAIIILSMLFLHYVLIFLSYRNGQTRNYSNLA